MLLHFKPDNSPSPEMRRRGSAAGKGPSLPAHGAKPCQGDPCAFLSRAAGSEASGPRAAGRLRALPRQREVLRSKWQETGQSWLHLAPDTSSLTQPRLV